MGTAMPGRLNTVTDGRIETVVAVLGARQSDEILIPSPSVLIICGRFVLSRSFTQ